MTGARPLLQVALDTPLPQFFDYLPPQNGPVPEPGQRVRVPFGRRETIGLVVGLAASSKVPAARLRHAIDVLDREPLLDAALLELLLWAAAYYQHAPGEVIAAALPVALRQGGMACMPALEEWRRSPAAANVDCAALQRKASVQATLLAALQSAEWSSEAELRPLHPNWRRTLQLMVARGWVETRHRTALPPLPDSVDKGPVLNPDQQQAVASISASGFQPCLVEGVTGSGKTEVYLQLIERQLAAGRQSLVLVPEIGLTPQLLERFRRRLRARLAVLHSGLTDTQRLDAWLQAKDGSADVIIGTRSAVFAPLARPGLLIVDEEHDSSYKQQEGFRYSARDLAVWRARQLQVPVVLGSATPALESIANVREGRYTHVRLPERTGNAVQPSIHPVDLRRHPPTDGLSQPLLDAARRHLAEGGQILLYLNRRGFAPAVLCRDCGHIAECPRCDARMVLHQQRQQLVCHHCGHERPSQPACPECGGSCIAVGQGTERVESALRQHFPATRIVRIDRDSTRRRGELERRLHEVRSGVGRILLGTQMLTKGHDFPDISLVGIIDSDQGLFGSDFRSSERLAQTLLQVAGRAGRHDRPGEVWLQSWFPDHPLLTTLLTAGYPAFAEQALAERRAAGWPPWTHVALLRSESTERALTHRFLINCRDAAATLDVPGIELLGPAAAPLERRSGRYRAQLLVRSRHRGRLQTFLTRWRGLIAGLPDARRNRWSLDVDPVELF